MKHLLRLWRGGSLVAAFVYFAYACATGAESGREGFDGTDAGEDVAKKPGSGVTPSTDSGSTPADGGAGDDDAGACDGKVVINELMTQGTTANDEFIELYNPGSCAVPLGDWKLAYRSYSGNAAPNLLTFAPGSAIPAKSFLVIGGSAFAGKKDATFTATSMAADNGQVGLIDDKGKMIDGIGYGTVSAAADGGTFVEKAAAQSPAAGGSLSRKTDGVDTDNNAADFAKTTPPSAGAPNP